MSRPAIRSVRRYLQRHSWVTAVTLLVILFVVGVFVIYQAEKTAKSDLTVFDAFTTVLVFFLGEYGEAPITPLGKMLSVVMFAFGIGVVAAIIGKFASYFVETNRGVKMPTELDRHIILCNWNDRGDRIIREIHSPLASPETEIVVISDVDIDEAQLRQHQEYEKVFFVRSDPTLHEVLKRARAHLARSVIILADAVHSDPDAKTALIALAITKLEKGGDHKPRIVAEVINHDKIQHLIDAGVDEWVCAADYGLGIVAQCALYGKLSEVYQQLLTYSSDTNEIYLVDTGKYPDSYIGKSFKELSVLMSQNRKTANPVILLGIKRDDRVVLNPKTSEFDSLMKNDSLIVVSFDQPDLRSSE